jgi:ribosomal protein S18 acetylase RimI-like enzyme
VTGGLDRNRRRSSHGHYQEHYDGAAFDVILVGAQPAGRLYVAREGDEIRIVDIALLPESCNRGIGTTLLRGLQSEAAAGGKPLRIHVERFNPALRLYERLRSPIAGFICSWSGERRSLPPEGGRSIYVKIASQTVPSPSRRPRILVLHSFSWTSRTSH